MKDRTPHVLVAGAGIGGLAATLALLCRGIDVDVYEQADSLSEVGLGVQISANGTGVLFELGLEEPVRHWGVRVEDKEIRLWNTGQTWSMFGRKGAPIASRYAYPMFLLHRGDLHAMLVGAVRKLKPDAIHLGQRCTGFEASDHGVMVQFGGKGVAGDILVGADGLSSVIRDQLFPGTPLTFSGQVVWRGLIPMERLPQHQRRMVSTNWIGPSAHATCYPLRRGEVMNFGGNVDQESWTGTSRIADGTVDECLADFTGWHEDVLRMVREAEKLTKWGIFLRAPLPRWTEGRVTLMGDACHAMLPYLGQGANSALEDAMVLARCVDRWHGDPAAGLARYEQLRRERTTRMVVGSNEMAGTFHFDDLSDAESAQRYVDKEWDPDRISARYDWIYRYDANLVALDPVAG